MNHRAFDIPGFNEGTPLDIYPGMRPEDVFVSLLEVEKENWSLGHGLAQYA